MNNNDYTDNYTNNDKFKRFEKLHEVLFTMIFKELHIDNYKKPPIRSFVMAAKRNINEMFGLLWYVKYYLTYNKGNFNKLSDTSLTFMNHIFEEMQLLVKD